MNLSSVKYGQQTRRSLQGHVKSIKVEMTEIRKRKKFQREQFYISKGWWGVWNRRICSGGSSETSTLLCFDVSLMHMREWPWTHKDAHICSWREWIWARNRNSRDTKKRDFLKKRKKSVRVNFLLSWWILQIFVISLIPLDFLIHINWFINWQ